MIDPSACLPTVVPPPEVIETPAPKVKVNLGCGQNLEEGWIGVDMVESKPGVRVHDLFTFPWPFEDGSVDEIVSSHFFEHVPGMLRPKFMDEVYRILKPGGKALFITPYYSSVRASQDFSHQWPPISDATYLYFNRGWREANLLTHGVYEMKCNFEANPIGVADDPMLNGRADEFKNFARRHYANSVNDIYVTLTKLP